MTEFTVRPTRFWRCSVCFSPGMRICVLGLMLMACTSYTEAPKTLSSTSLFFNAQELTQKALDRPALHHKLWLTGASQGEQSLIWREGQRTILRISGPETLIAKNLELSQVSMSASPCGGRLHIEWKTWANEQSAQLFNEWQLTRHGDLEVSLPQVVGLILRDESQPFFFDVRSTSLSKTETEEVFELCGLPSELSTDALELLVTLDASQEFIALVPLNISSPPKIQNRQEYLSTLAAQLPPGTGRNTALRLGAPSSSSGDSE